MKLKFISYQTLQPEVNLPSAFQRFSHSAKLLRTAEDINIDDCGVWFKARQNISVTEQMLLLSPILETRQRPHSCKCLILPIDYS